MLQPTDRPPASRRPTIGSFHHARASPGHDGEPQAADRRADFASQLVVAMPLAEPRGSEDGHARADEMQHAEAANEVARGAEQDQQLFEARMRTFQKVAVVF